MAARYARFYPETIGFLEELGANNNRDWFNANKSRYEEQVLDVALRFIQSMQDPLHKMAPRFVASPTRVGGSLMRVYRDTRFSKNKTPYKTNIGIQFRHEQAKDVHSPGYYLHIDPEQVDTTAPFDSYGLDSAAAVGMTGELEEWLEADVDPVLPYDYPTVEALARRLSGETGEAS